MYTDRKFYKKIITKIDHIIKSYKKMYPWSIFLVSRLIKKYIDAYFQLANLIVRMIYLQLVDFSKKKSKFFIPIYSYSVLFIFSSIFLVYS